MQTEETHGPTGTVLDAHEAQSGGWLARKFSRRPPPTALELASAALEECRRDQLHHSQLAEFHTAIRRMLGEREARLAKDIARLSRPSKDSTQGASHGE